jgi:hypothetical protein
MNEQSTLRDIVSKYPDIKWELSGNNIFGFNGEHICWLEPKGIQDNKGHFEMFYKVIWKKDRFE